MLTVLLQVAEAIAGLNLQADLHPPSYCDHIALDNY